MSRKWKIGPGGVHGGPNSIHLIDCTIARDTHTEEYYFLGPVEGDLPLAAVKMPVAFPFWFPKFRAPLNGKNDHDWYIRVDYVDGGRDFNQAHGHWSNSPPPPHDDSEIVDTDTWTTSAGVGAEPEGDKKDKNKKVAASASAKQ